MPFPLRGVFRFAVMGAIVLAQIGAAPPKHFDYDATWYVRPQRMVDVGGRRLNIVCEGGAIQLDHPTTVISAVDEVVDQARARGRTQP